MGGPKWEIWKSIQMGWDLKWNLWIEKKIYKKIKEKMGAIERFQASPIECKLGITKTLGFVYAGAIQDSKAIFFSIQFFNTLFRCSCLYFSP